MAFLKPADFDSSKWDSHLRPEKKITAAAMDVTSAPWCQAAHIHQIHTAMPKHAFRWRKKPEKKTVAGVRRLSHTSRPQICLVSAFEGFCFVPVLLRKAKWKRGSGSSAVLYAAVHCEINELSLTLEFLQPAFWKGQCCDIATLLICRSETGYIDQIAF